VVESVLADLKHSLEHSFAHGTDPIAEWISAMFAAITKRKRLFSVLVEEVPFLQQVPAVVAARERLQELALRARSLRDKNDTAPHVEAMTYLMPIMVANAVIESVIRAPRDLPPRDLEQALILAVKRLTA
jgi:hypothetical protein